MARSGSAPVPPVDSLELRFAVFDYLDALLDEYGPSVPRTALETGSFHHEGRPLRLTERRRAILKPAGWNTVLTVTTNLGVDGQGRYQDELDASGRLHYVFMEETQASGAAYNRALLTTMAAGLPLVLMVKVTSGFLAPIYPYLIESRDERGVTLAPGDDTPAQFAAEHDLRRYRRRWAKERIHQEAFRISVLDAYGERCCVCRINYRGLLDAAQIIEDSLLYGQPVLENGLALCKIHHAAYDGALLGIDPDGIVHVRSDLLQAKDGPMLRHGLQGFHREPMRRPNNPRHAPARERLAHRWNRFLARQG
jgi:putative restriction endonuclease